MPRPPKLHKKKIGKSNYWYTEAGGETYFGNVTDVGYDNARRLFSAHIQSLVEEEPGSKSKRLTADELIDLFLDSATDQSRGFCLPSWVKVVTSPFANPSTP